MRKKPPGHGTEQRSAQSGGLVAPESRPGTPGLQRPSATSGGRAPVIPVPGSDSWPGWARVVVTLALLYHMAAVVAGAMGVPPSSELERRIADFFTPYHDLVDQGYAYRYYAEPPPTPVITARLRFGDGRPDELVRLPERNLPGPLMRHQRQLALANALTADFEELKQMHGENGRSRLAAAYARHLCATHPGCKTVTLHSQQHMIPDPQHVREHLATPGAAVFDLFDEELFTTPQWIGDFECDGS